MKKLISLMMILMLALSCVALVGCGGDDDEDKDDGGATQQATAEEGSPEDMPTSAETPADDDVTAPETPGTADIDDLMEIFGGIDEINCVQYTMTMAGGGVPSMDAQVWLKDGKMRTETTMMGMTTTMIIDPEAGKAYSITPGGAMEIAIPAEAQSAVDSAEAAIGYGAKVVGTEEIDGKKSKVVEYTAEGFTTKMWVWEDKGFPIKIETTTPEGTMVMEMTDIEFDCASDDMFELPEGVEPGMVIDPENMFGDMDPEALEEMLEGFEGMEGMDLEGMMPSQ